MPNPFVDVANAKFTIAHGTDPGRTGKNNEDNYAVFDSIQRINHEPDGLAPVQVALIADGIGGSVSGEIASQMTVDTFVEQFRQGVNLNIHERLDVAIHDANRAIFTAGLEQPELKGMGTTIVATAI